jgi:O-antigen ligase
MQTTKTFQKDPFTPAQREVEQTLAGQIAAYHMRQRQIFRLRTVQQWWPSILLTVGGIVVATILGQYMTFYPKVAIGILAGAIGLFLCIRYVELGFFLLAFTSTAFFPELFAIKSLQVYPSMLLLVLMFFVLLFQAAFRTRPFVWPSFWTIWPQLGLIVTAFVSDIMIQFTWTPGVPHQLNSNPIIYDEVLGIILCAIPLILIITTTGFVSKKERLIEYIQRMILVTAFIGGVILLIDFKRIGATIYTFRYTEPMILWMRLRALVQLLVLGAIIAYVRLLYARTWRQRIIYGLVVVVTLVATYLSLENSWWLEAAFAFIIITLLYSWKLFLGFCVAGLGLIPVVKNELTKLQAVKSVDAYRFIIWQDMLRVWKMHPLLGVGPGNLWTYDQYFTQLPRLLRDFNKTGLGVAHNGYLQTLGEMGFPGLFFYLAFIVVFFVIAFRLYRRSKSPAQRDDRMLALEAIGLLVGSAVADFVAGSFFLPPRQLGIFHELTNVILTWIMFGFVLYKDKLWRIAQQKSPTAAIHSDPPAPADLAELVRADPLTTNY